MVPFQKIRPRCKVLLSKKGRRGAEARMEKLTLAIAERETMDFCIEIHGTPYPDRSFMQLNE